MLALPPLAAEAIFNIGSFTVTNTYINSTLTVFLFIVVGFLIKRNVKEVPRGIQNFFESVIEILLGYFDQVTGDRKKSMKFLPLIGSLFLFILISNWLGILPGVGSIGISKVVHGELEFIPLFRPANTDLNLTLAMAITGVILSHIIGVFTIGFFKYFNKFVKLSDVWHAFKSKKVMVIFTAFIEFMVGFLEIISEAAKMVSLSLRLFGNIFAGEVLLTVLASIVAYIVPLPFLALELLVGLIQATVFSLLVLTYITVATMPVHGHGDSHNKEKAAH
ncbi:MAG: F0F1 ATP synthase subunit A [Candidatus Doudnabacteria bacterium]